MRRFGGLVLVLSASLVSAQDYCPMPSSETLYSIDTTPPMPEAAQTCSHSIQEVRQRDLAELGRLWQTFTGDDTRAALFVEPRLRADLPELADLIAYRRGDLLRASVPHRTSDASYTVLERQLLRNALAAYSEAMTSLDADRRLRSETRRSLVRLQLDERNSADEASRLLRLYRELPEASDVLYALGQHYRRVRNANSASQSFERLLVDFPNSAAARLAASELATMQEDHRALSYSAQVRRAETLVRRGPLDEAQTALSQLATYPLPRALALKVGDLRARLDRHYGRSENPADVLRIDREAALRSLARLGYRADLRRVSSNRLRVQISEAAKLGLVDIASQLIEEAAKRDLPLGVRTEISLTVMGVVDDGLIVDLLADAMRPADASVRGPVRSLYYLGRALKRSGRNAEAAAAFAEVRERDSFPHYYRMLAELHSDGESSTVTASSTESSDEVEFAGKPIDEVVVRPVPAPAQPSPSVPMTESREPEIDVVPPSLPTGARSAIHFGEGMLDPARIVPTPAPRFDLASTLATLDGLSTRHPSYPWFARAALLLRLGDRQNAAGELHQAYLAWRDATGRTLSRAGYVSIARDGKRPRNLALFADVRNRRLLSSAEREQLATIATQLDEYAAATGYLGQAAVQRLPRAHAALVEQAAARHGLDPNLVFAVMRVESVYQRDIISYAGAIGLCQIMPRTGALIAAKREERDYHGDDLLDPATNLDFAAWYLRTLIDRFDGHLPLAIASYNGGPHNVRTWIQEYSPELELDAFLEHIPFDQTHRYVRRVLTYYAAYRAQQGLPMIELSNNLPQPGADGFGF